jgi:hypothetical protein
LLILLIRRHSMAISFESERYYDFIDKVYPVDN